MSTVSVSLSTDLAKKLDDLVAQGVASNKADGMRRALRKFSEDQAVERILRAEKEPSLKGDLDELAARLR